MEFDESNERYGGIDEDEDEEEQRRAMRKIPKGEIKLKEDGEEIVGQSGVSSTQEKDEGKPPDTQDQDQSRGQGSPPQE